MWKTAGSRMPKRWSELRLIFIQRQITFMAWPLYEIRSLFPITQKNAIWSIFTGQFRKIKDLSISKREECFPCTEKIKRKKIRPGGLERKSLPGVFLILQSLWFFLIDAFGNEKGNQVAYDRKCQYAGQ